MEALLRHLRSYGMTDLSFIIVNSKEPRSVPLIGLLKNAVSFPVYQETEEEKVWTRLEGRKDDMYVYDRCGRLTYHIPFPLSVIHEEQPIVQAAVLSTYFQHPCGVACSTNSTFAINALDEEIPEEAIHHSNSSKEPVHVENQFYEVTSDANTTSENKSADGTDFDYYDIYGNFTANGNETYDNFTMTDYEENNATSSPHKVPAEGTRQEGQSILLSLVRFILGSYESMEDSEPDSSAESPGETNRNSTVRDNEIPYEAISDPHTADDLRANSNDTQVFVSGKCNEIDENVCKEWSKKKLLQAQKCCASITDINDAADAPTIRGLRSCKNYGKKRCKKMQPLFKCCLKTEISEEDAEKRM